MSAHHDRSTKFLFLFPAEKAVPKSAPFIRAKTWPHAIPAKILEPSLEKFSLTLDHRGFQETHHSLHLQVSKLEEIEKRMKFFLREIRDLYPKKKTE